MAAVPELAGNPRCLADVDAMVFIPVFQVVPHRVHRFSLFAINVLCSDDLAKKDRRTISCGEGFRDTSSSVTSPASS